MSRAAPRPRARGTATFLAAGCLVVVTLLAAATLGGDPGVNLLAAAMTLAVGVLMLVGAALYLIGGPRRVVPVRRVILLAAVLPAIAVVGVALLP